MNRIATGAAAVALGLAVLGGTAGAQVGTNRSAAEGASDVPTVNTTTTTAGQNVPDGVLGESIDAPAGAGDVLAGGASQAAPARAEAERAPSGSLPVTGGDVVGLTLIGAAAVAVGALLIRRSRATT